MKICQEENRQKRRGSGADEHDQKRDENRGDVRSDARETVVRIEVHEHQDGESSWPCPPNGVAGDHLGEHLGVAGLAERPGESDESSVPDGHISG